MTNNPKVSVCVMTYNQESFIGGCLDSLLSQECNFDFEIIVGEDCSTDKTRAIVQEYANKYPDIIKLLLHDKNIGGEKNYLLVHSAANGEYICNMDGDDFTLPGKLQAQADFMDKTPDCNIAFHRVTFLYPDGNVKDDTVNYSKIKNGFDRKDILQYMAVAVHSSKMYRKSLKKFDIPNFVVSDFYMNVEQIKGKKAYYIGDQLYGVYRVGIGQSTNSSNFMEELIVNTLECFLNKYPEEKDYINSLYLFLFLAALKNRRRFVLYLKWWLRSFSMRSILLLAQNWNIRTMFKTKK